MTLVGAGLVGSLLSLYLAKRGYKVKVYERRPDMRKENISAGRSINLAISTRGLFALREVGLENEVLKVAIPMKGRMIHSITGGLAFQPYGTEPTDCINSVSRGELNKILMNAAEASGNVAIEFNRKIESLSELGDESRIIATDGSASAIRHDLMKNRGFENSETYLEHGYKELHIPAGDNGRFVMEKNALHIWPRGTYMLIALPNLDGSFTATLFLPHRGPLSFESLKTPQDVAEFFNEHFPDAVPLMPDLAETFFGNPIGHMVTVKCSPWSRDGRVLLMGDAAHAIVPFFGQGMNCGFEDCTVFNQILSRHGSDWKGVFSEFFSMRKIHTDAIADMAVENFIEMRDKVAHPGFLLEKGVERLLHEKFPQDYISRYALVTFSRIPYGVAYGAGLIESEILSELCVNLSNPDQVDLVRAEKLIREKLTPYLKKEISSGFENQR